MRLLLTLLLILNTNTFANEICFDAEEQFSEIHQVQAFLDDIRKHHTERVMIDEIEELQKLVKEKGIDLSEYGIGGGAYDIWKRRSLEAAEKRRVRDCMRKENVAPLKSLGDYKSESHRVSTKVAHEPIYSTVKKKDMEEIFHILASKKHIPHRYLFAGCEARAVEMAIIMDSMCLTSGRAFLQGKIALRGAYWNTYHTAPILNVEENGKLVPYVIDPAFFDKPVPMEEWVALFRRSYMMDSHTLHLTNQYVYMLEDKDKNPTRYRYRDLLKKNIALDLFKFKQTAHELPDTTVDFLKKVFNSKYQ